MLLAMRARHRVSPGLLLGAAVRAVLLQRGRSALTALSVTIGVAAVVWVVALGKAGTEQAEAQLQALGDNLIWIEAGSRNINGVRTGTHGTTSLTIDDARAIFDEVPLLKGASPQVDGNVLVVNGNRNWTTHYRGVSPSYLAIKRWPPAEGASFTDEEVESASSVCMIGQTVREQLFGAASPVGQVVRIGVQPFHIVGVLSAKGQSATGQDQDDTLLMPYTTAQRTIRGRGVAWLDDILCSAVSPGAVKPAVDEIVALLRQRHHVIGEADDFNIRRPEELIKAQIEASRTFALLLISIAAISLLVGGIGIMNVMLASVTERTREIGLRLAVGATGRSVQLQFLLEAVLVSLFGGFWGVVLSALGSTALGSLLGWPVTIPVQAVALALAFSIAVGVVFGFIPARRAAGMDPIDALRHD
jgi:putative ABC transport system permease protein